MSSETRDILTNKWAIEVNQDPLGRQAVLMPSKSHLLQRDETSAPPQAIVAPCDNSSKSQRWTLAPDGHVQVASGHCLDVFDCQSGEHVAVNLYPCKNDSNKCGVHLNQKFKFRQSSGSASVNAVGTITNDAAGACLGIAGANMKVEAQPCLHTIETTGKNGQLWRFPADPGGLQAAQIVHNASGMCLSTPSSAPAPSPPTPPTPTSPPTPAPAPTQVWIKPLAAPEGAFALVLLNRGKSVANISFSFADMPFDARHLQAPRYSVSDLWKDGASLGVKSGGAFAVVKGTAVAFYKLVPAS